MLQAHGYIYEEVNGRVREHDTVTCAHCQRVWAVAPGTPATDHAGWCMRCARPVCAVCATTPVCVPFEKRLEQMEASARFQRGVSL